METKTHIMAYVLHTSRYYKHVKNNKKTNFSKLVRAGISLIVLVITIIIVVILATTVIVTISTNNPVIEANTARYTSDLNNVQAVFTSTVAKIMAQNKSAVSINVTSINKETRGVTQTTGEVKYKVINAENAANSNGKIIFGEGTNTDTVFYTGKELPIYSAGETKWYVDEYGQILLEISGEKYGKGDVTLAKLVAGEANKYYGADVLNYSTGNDTIDNQVKWKIFYSDGTNLYLIATDYISGNLCPPTGKGNVVYQNTEYRLSFNNIIADYNGSEDITDEKLIKLNSDYFAKGYTSANANLKSIAYLMDISENV